MTDMKLRKLVLAALFAALCTVMTMVIQVPSPMQGYVNLGDCAVLLSAWVLGPWYGSAAAGLGSMLADLLSYPHYAPGTLVIKFTMAVAAAYIFEAMRERSGKLAAQLIGGAAAEIIMVLGYFGYEPVARQGSGRGGVHSRQPCAGRVRHCRRHRGLRGARPQPRSRPRLILDCIAPLFMVSC